MAHSSGNVELPLSVITIIDLGRLERELASIDDFSLQSAIRDAGKQPKLPKISRNLEQMANLNDFNLLIDEDRKKMTILLKALREQAPIVHMSFASDPNLAFLTKIITWFRAEIQPHILLQIGLQPSIAAGCIVRTSNKYFDFSLRKHFAQNHQKLIEQLAERK